MCGARLLPELAQPVLKVALGPARASTLAKLVPERFSCKNQTNYMCANVIRCGFLRTLLTLCVFRARSRTETYIAYLAYM